MKIKNQAMLITYSDSLGKNLKDLKNVLEGPLKDVVGGIHILPFFPSSGDRGFAPMDYTKVDPAFGDWSDIEKKDESAYADLFIRYKNFWPNGEPTQEDVDLIYKRKPRAPYRIATFADGSEEKVWCTFDEQQIDLDVTTETTRQFIQENLEQLAEHGASIIRLDAFAYANKKIGTNCFFVEPDIWEMLHFPRQLLAPKDVEILPEIHEHYTIQQKIAEQDYYVYDFALPMLVLHALYSGHVNRLIHWMEICPRKQFTTLDTHDGIGVVDVKDLLTDEEIEETREALYAQGANVKKIYSTEAYNNLDIYQINCTYYSALGNNDQAYLLARVLQCFAPGIPQIYYVGLLAGENDIELLKFRNTSPAFDGEFSVKMLDETSMEIFWNNQDAGVSARLTANLKEKFFEIVEIEEDKITTIELQYDYIERGEFPFFLRKLDCTESFNICQKYKKQIGGRSPSFTKFTLVVFKIQMEME